MKKHYQCPKAKIIINDSPISVICTSGSDGVSATMSGYGSGSGGFSQHNSSGGSNAPGRNSPWDE